MVIRGGDSYVNHLIIDYSDDLTMYAILRPKYI